MLHSILSSTRCNEGVKIIRLLNFSNLVPFSFYLGHSGCSYLSDRYSFFGERPLAIAAMNAEHNSKSASTFDHDITPSSAMVTEDYSTPAE